MIPAYPPGGWFNMKMPSYQYRKSNYGDKTIIRSSIWIPSIGIPIMEIRRSYDRLISIMGFPILVRLVRGHIDVESGPQVTCHLCIVSSHLFSASLLWACYFPRRLYPGLLATKWGRINRLSALGLKLDLNMRMRFHQGHLKKCQNKQKHFSHLKEPKEIIYKKNQSVIIPV